MSLAVRKLNWELVVAVAFSLLIWAIVVFAAIWAIVW